jgi:hypothetical protein
LKRLNLVNAKTVFIATISIVATLTLLVYLTGLESHRSLYLNSLVTTSILSVIFLCFITIGLYKGWKLKDTIGSFKKYLPEFPSNASIDVPSAEMPDIGEGIEGCVLSFLLWIVIAFFGAIILWFIGAFFWGIILVLAALLYWIFFRALRLIFRNAAKCKGNLIKSLQVSIIYTCLYISWIYAIILGGHYLGH